MDRRNSKRNHSLTDRVFDWVDFVFLLASLLVVLYPLVYILSNSFSNSKAVLANKVFLWPIGFNTTAYELVLSNKQIGMGYLNSLCYVVLGTSLSVLLTMLLGYSLSRKEFYGRKTLTKIILFTMLFNGGTIPLYLVVREVGIYDTIGAMILPNAMSVYNVIIARTFLKENIPDDLYDAAQIDGCSDIRFFFQIVFPLSGAIVAVLSLFYAVGQWNKYFDALLYLQKQSLYPLQIVLRNILIINRDIDPSMIADATAAAKAQGLSEVIRYAVIVVASAPLLAIYPFVQKFFVKGVMIGSVKG